MSDNIYQFGGSVFDPWNGINRDSPFAPWNGIHRDDPFVCWNDPFVCWNDPFGHGSYEDEARRER